MFILLIHYSYCFRLSGINKRSVILLNIEILISQYNLIKKLRNNVLGEVNSFSVHGHSCPVYREMERDVKYLLKVIKVEI